MNSFFTDVGVRLQAIGLFLSNAMWPIRVPRWIRTILGVVVVLVVLGYFSGRVAENLNEVRQAWQPVSWFYLALATVLLVICLFVMALLWYGLLKTMGGRIPLAKAVLLYGLTLLPRYMPGLVWGYAGRAVWCERYGVAKKISAASTIAEIGLIVLTGLTIVTLRHFSWAWTIVFGAPALLFPGGLLLARITNQDMLLARFKQALVWYGWALAYLVFWFVYGISSWFVVLSIAPNLDFYHAAEVVTSYVSAWLVGFLIILVPSGLGIRESVFAIALVPILGPIGSIFVPLLARFISLLSEALFSLLCYLAWRTPFQNASWPE